jgi:benzoyl-CoA reductase/2-hydroxyglutaryl-CoA dehydratase subunit BcrC/BadD/HgdB
MSTPVDVEDEGSALAKEELIAALEINCELCDEDITDKGIIGAYAKWKAINIAYKKMQAMTWNGSKPTYGAIISLFVSTSMFYSHYKYFNDAVKHPEMLEWLEERPDGPSNIDIWGREKSHYTFVDLIKWLKEAGDQANIDSSDDGRKRGKKLLKKREKSSPEKDGKKSHKAKKGSKK